MTSGAGLQDQNRAAATKIKAERVIGDKLGQLEKARGGRPSKKTPDTLSGVSGDQDDDLPTLAELGISHKQLSRWQAVASAPRDHSPTGDRREKRLFGHF